jgi:hypothetical protein
MRNRIIQAAFVAAYLGLAAVVTFGAFWINHEFDKSHHTQCQIATAQVEIAAAAESRPLVKQNMRLLNDAIDRLNDECGLNLEHV